MRLGKGCPFLALPCSSPVLGLENGSSWRLEPELAASHTAFPWLSLCNVQLMCARQRETSLLVSVLPRGSDTLSVLLEAVSAAASICLLHVFLVEVIWEQQLIIGSAAPQ